jgi:hypothetical protein
MLIPVTQRNAQIKFAAFQALSIPVHIRVDNITYSFLGESNRVNGSVNLTSIVISPTQTKLTATAGPMQCNLTFLNPIEVRTKSCGRLLSAHASVLAWRLGQAIDPFLIPVIDCGIVGRCGSCCAGVFGCHWTWVNSLLLYLFRCVLKDIAEWLSGDRSQQIGWSTTSNNNLIYHTVGLQNPAVFNEIDTQADWGTLYYAMKSVSDTGTICISHS